MENSGAERVAASEDASHLTRSRSFKSKQLVRSQAIRESQSPPRVVSPIADDVNIDSSQLSDNPDVISYDKESYSDDCKKHLVEIQITSGSWDEQHSEQRQRTKRWLGHRHHSDSSRDLLSNNPRVACVCGACAACPQCRGRRRRTMCPTKQDSGVVCSEDCSDSEQSGSNPDGVRKSDTSEIDEQAFYCRCPDRKENKPKNMLSRTDSDERSEPSGPELVSFIKETLNKNPRDRMTLLKIEKELHSLVNDTGRCIVRFPVMTSYGRMLVHRCAALFQLAHHIDQNNKTSVLVSKSGTSGGRIPCTSFRAWCLTSFPPSPHRAPHGDTRAKSILKRDTHSLDEPENGALANARSKSLEQREREYERVRRRIFSSDNCTQDESQWPWGGPGPVKVLTPEGGRNKLLKVQSLESSGGAGGSWRRGAVAKSHSFGGYAGADPPPRLLSRQGDLASSSWRLSPSSSGYKTLSLRSTDSVTPSPTGGASPEPANTCVGNAPPDSSPAVDNVGAGVGANMYGTVVWAVTDMAAVPAGALVIHPQTGRPLTNPDGSIYHFDPANPPVLYDPAVYTQTDQTVETNCERRRGKLEKQHSFIDNECECQPTADCRNKCCCGCRRHDSSPKNVEKTISTPEKKSAPPSPCKTHYDTTRTELTNHRTAYDAPANQNAELTNHIASYEATANQKEPIRNYEQRFESSNQIFEQNYERYDQRPPSFDSANQRVVHDVPTNQRTVVNKLTNQDSQEYNCQYPTAIRSNETISPPQVANHTYVQDTSVLHAITAQAKLTPVPMQDPNIRPVSLTNMMYSSVPQGYPYMNQCRMDQSLQQVYQPILHEEQKQLAPSPLTNESTFRIDPSYPYGPVDYAAQCGACVDPATLQQQRSYNVQYGQVDVPTVLPPYPIGNMVVPQPHLQHYSYQEPVQWQSGTPLLPLGAPPKLIVPELYPLIYPYPPYNVYPQVLPPAYPLCPPPRAPLDAQRRSLRPRRGSAPHTPHTPHTPHAAHDENKYHDNIHGNQDKNFSRQNSNEIAMKIQQIKEQMASLNTRDDKRNRGRRDGHGLLGSHPQERHGSNNDDTQLSSAARAIVNTIRNMQAKNYHQDRRPDFQYRTHDRRRMSPARDSPARDDRRLPPPTIYRPPYLCRQMSPGTWCRRSPAPVHPVLNHPRRPHPDLRNQRR